MKVQFYLTACLLISLGTIACNKKKNSSPNAPTTQNGVRDTIAFARVVLKATTNWKSDTIHFAYKMPDSIPDSVAIIFAASAKVNFESFFKCEGEPGSALWVDNIKLLDKNNNTVNSSINCDFNGNYNGNSGYWVYENNPYNGKPGYSNYWDLDSNTSKYFVTINWLNTLPPTLFPCPLNNLKDIGFSGDSTTTKDFSIKAISGSTTIGTGTNTTKIFMPGIISAIKINIAVAASGSGGVSFGKPYTAKEQGISFDYKYIPQNGDSAVFFVLYSKWRRL